MLSCKHMTSTHLVRANRTCVETVLPPPEYDFLNWNPILEVSKQVLTPEIDSKPYFYTNGRLHYEF